jgi:imidazoleglycerol-phosphate dehydratase
VQLDLRRERLGALSTENIPHVVQTLAMSARICIHLDVLRGVNDHHKAEAAFKALALALRTAIARDAERMDEVPSTKGTLEPRQELP